MVVTNDVRHVPCSGNKDCCLCCCHFMQTMTMMNTMLMATESPSKAARADSTMVAVIVAVSIRFHNIYNDCSREFWEGTRLAIADFDEWCMYKPLFNPSANMISPGTDRVATDPSHSTSKATTLK